MVKLAKCGGILEALRVIGTARAHGMRVMFGMMIESSIGIVRHPNYQVYVIILISMVHSYSKTIPTRARPGKMAI